VLPEKQELCEELLLWVLQWQPKKLRPQPVVHPKQHRELLPQQEVLPHLEHPPPQKVHPKLLQWLLLLLEVLHKQHHVLPKLPEHLLKYFEYII
jgi:hypothetical protein